MAPNRAMIGATLTAAVVSAGFALTGVASAATTTESVSVFASDDAYTSSTRKTVNFGAADKLVVGRDGGETRVSYVKFVVKPLAAGATVSDAELRLPVDGKPVAATLTLLQVPNTAWSEKTLTAAKAPALGKSVDSLKPAVKDTVLSFDVSDVVTKAGTYAFALKSASTTDVTRLRAVEYGDPNGGGPELQLTVTKKATTPVTTKPTTTAPTTGAPSATPSQSVPASTSAGTSPVETTPVSGDGGGDGELPLTGSAAAGVAGGAFLLLVAGAVLYILARRRKVNFTA